MKVKTLKKTLLFLSLLLLFYACDKEVSVSTPDEWKIEKAKIFINSSPANAEIFVDGKSTGLKTPDTIKWLSNSEHEITLKMNLFMDFTFLMTAEDEKTNGYFHNYYDYSYNFARLNIYSEPDSASIYFNDSLLVKKTPYSIRNIFPGNHKIKLTYPEHRADSLELFLRGGMDKTVNFTLTDTSIWVNYSRYNSPLTSHIINDIKIVGENEIWVGTSDNGIASFKGNSWSFITKENSLLAGNGINRFDIDSYNNIWACTYSGLSKYNGSDWQSYSTFNSNLPSNYITDIYFKDNDTVLIGTQRGLVKFYNNKFETLNTINSGIPADFISAIAIDKQQNLWLGSVGFGVFKFDGENWVTYTMDVDGLPGNAVSDINIDANGTVWVTFISRETKGERGGIAKLENGFWKTLNFELVFPSTERIKELNDGSIMFATRSGVVWYRSESNYKVFNAGNSGLIRNDITSIEIDSRGTFWFSAMGGGLTKYKLWNE
ncbi:MAG: PEGA domain-containing protein [Melioribacteraceae bacterium]|nr:PEGA domain-containing protein [Melioribacteraceae bacterium]